MILQQDVGYHRLIRGQFLLSFFFFVLLYSPLYFNVLYSITSFAMFFYRRLTAIQSSLINLLHADPERKAAAGCPE
jgi:hypothetical protein